MLELRAFGTLALHGADFAQPKRLALLCYLALARPRGLHRRDRLVGLFWPELDDAHARQSLRQALTAIRALDERLVLSRGDDEVGIAPGTLACDVLAFEQTLEQGERVAALERYIGPFLDGFFLSDCPEFERWVEGERARLRGLAAEAAWKLAEQEQVPAAAVHWARRAAGFQPDDEGALRRLVSVLDRAGDRAGALREYEAFARRLKEEYQAEPAPETRRLVADVRARSEPAPASASHPTAGVATTPLPEHRRPSARVRLALMALGLVALLVALAGIWKRNSPAPDTLSVLQSVAVLPFENLSGSPEQEYFSDGMRDDIASALINSGLRVAPRASSYAYKGKRPRPQEVGATLHVGAVVSGSVSRLGRHLHLSVELMTARDGATLWSFSTEREARDVFTVQRAILDSIVRLLKPQLLSRVGPALSRQTTDLQAHDLVLEGRYRAQTNTRAGLMRSVELFNQALARDPGYALAYVSLAESYSLLGDGYVAPSEMLPNSFAATERALALDSTLGEAWSKRCENDLYQWNWARAKTDLDRAQVLNPNDLEALYCETYYWVAMRRPGQAVAAARKSAALDPLAPGTRQSLAFAFLLAGEPDSAIAWSLAATKLQPGYAYVDAVDGYAYAATGRIAEAERAFRQAEPLLGHRSPGLAYVLALADRHAEAREVVRDIERDWGTHYVVPEFLATAYLALGDTGKMYEWLGKGVDLHSAYAWFNGLWPPFRSVRDQPHFKAILRRQNLIP